MKITIEVTTDSELKELMHWLSRHPLAASVQLNNQPSNPLVIKGNKKLDPMALFGIWKDEPRTVEDIRQNAWSGRL